MAKRLEPLGPPPGRAELELRTQTEQDSALLLLVLQLISLTSPLADVQATLTLVSSHEETFKPECIVKNPNGMPTAIKPLKAPDDAGYSLFISFLGRDHRLDRIGYQMIVATRLKDDKVVWRVNGSRALVLPDRVQVLTEDAIEDRDYEGRLIRKQSLPSDLSLCELLDRDIALGVRQNVDDSDRYDAYVLNVVNGDRKKIGIVGDPGSSGEPRAARVSANNYVLLDSFRVDGLYRPSIYVYGLWLQLTRTPPPKESWVEEEWYVDTLLVSGLACFGMEYSFKHGYRLYQFLPEERVTLSHLPDGQWGQVSSVQDAELLIYRINGHKWNVYKLSYKKRSGN